MLSGIGRHLVKLDMLGPLVPLSFNYQPQIQTNIGGFFSLIFIGLTIFFSISNFLVYFRKSEPRVVQNSYYNSIPKNISISDMNFPLMISFENDEDRKTSFAGYCYIIDQQNDTLLESIPLILESCTSLAFYLLPQAEVDKVKSQNTYCIQNLNFKIFGDSQSSRLSMLNFEFSLSSNNSIHFYYLGAEANPDNYSNPIQYYLDEIVAYSSDSFSKEMQLQLQKNDYITKYGLFYNKVTNISYITVKNSLVNYSDIKNSLVINLILGKHETVTIRTYINIYEIISNIMGSSDIAFSFLAFLVSPLNLIKFYHEISNFIFSFENNNTGKVPYQIEYSRNILKDNLEKINDDLIGYATKLQNLKKKDKEYRLNLSNCDYIRSFMCKKRYKQNQNLRLFNIAINELKQLLEVRNIIKNEHTVEKIIYSTYSEEEICLFRLLPDFLITEKDNVSNAENPINYHRRKMNCERNNKMKLLRYLYQTHNNGKNHSDIMSRLIDMNSSKLDLLLYAKPKELK